MTSQESVISANNAIKFANDNLSDYINKTIESWVNDQGVDEDDEDILNIKKLLSMVVTEETKTAIVRDLRLIDERSKFVDLESLAIEFSNIAFKKYFKKSNENGE